MAVVADFKMSELAGSGVANDTGGPTAENGAYLNGATPNGSGQVELDGLDDYIEVPADPAFALTEGTIQIEATMASASPSDFPYGSNAAYTLFSVDSSDYDGGGHLSIYVTSDGSVAVRHQTDTGNHVYSGGSVSVGQPFSVSYSFGPDGSTLTVNGIEVDTGTVPLEMAGGVEPITIGASQAQSGDGVADNMRGHFHGSIDRVVIDDSSSAAMICFAEDTLIETPEGARLITDLKAGDHVTTRDDGAVPIRMVQKTVVSAAALRCFTNLRPIIIGTGALGNKTPLRVTRQHCLLAETDRGLALIRAAHFQKFGGARFEVDPRCMTQAVLHLLLDRHAIIYANGVAAETLLPGAPLSRRAAPNGPIHAKPQKTCYPILTGAQARRALRTGRWRIPRRVEHAQTNDA
jgi:hypothetical protein